MGALLTLSRGGDVEREHDGTGTQDPHWQCHAWAGKGAAAVGGGRGRRCSDRAGGGGGCSPHTLFLRENLWTEKERARGGEEKEEEGEKC